MCVLETCRCCPVPLEVRFLSGSQVSAARGGLRLIQAPRLLVDFAKSSGARSDLAVLARAGVASVVPGRASGGAGAKAGNFHRGEDSGSGRRRWGRRSVSFLDGHGKQHGRPQRTDQNAAQRYGDDAGMKFPRRLFRDHHFGNRRSVHCEDGGECMTKR